MPSAAGRRIVIAVGAVVGFVAAGLWFFGVVQAQQPFPVPANGPAVKVEAASGGVQPAQFSAIKLEVNPEFRKIINGVRDAFRDKEWNVGVKALQDILDSKEDFYVQVREKDANGAETLRWTSV